MASITADMVVRQWGRMPGKTSAARVFRVLRTIWNHAREARADIGESPTRALRNVRRSWAQAPRKRRMIPDALMPAWRDAVSTIGHEGIRDLVWFVFYTGCRIGEARALTAGDVDLQAGTFRLAAPKNGRQLELPIVAQLGDVLERRLATAPRGPIFPQDLSRYWLRPTLEVCQWSWHDLRRGYIAAAHRAGTDPEVARALVNHSAPAGDSHGGYVILSADSMRSDAQRVAGFLDRLGVHNSKVVVEWEMKQGEVSVKVEADFTLAVSTDAIPIPMCESDRVKSRSRIDSLDPVMSDREAIANHAVDFEASMGQLTQWLIAQKVGQSDFAGAIKRCNREAQRLEKLADMMTVEGISAANAILEIRTRSTAARELAGRYRRESRSKIEQDLAADEFLHVWRLARREWPPKFHGKSGSNRRCATATNEPVKRFNQVLNGAGIYLSPERVRGLLENAAANLIPNHPHIRHFEYKCTVISKLF